MGNSGAPKLGTGCALRACRTRNLEARGALGSALGLPAGALSLQGDHSVGKYRCLLCQKEFSSESGVKYHIIKAHSEVRKQLGLLRGPAATRPRSVCPSPAPQICPERGAAAPISISRVGTASGQGTELLCQPGGASVLPFGFPKPPGR